MPNPKISIIVSTYNRHDLLERCLKALKNQTLPETDYEIIVIDDGSTDGTKETVDAIKMNSPLKYFYQEKMNYPVLPAA